jgi:hypothetical protein
LQYLPETRLIQRSPEFLAIERKFVNAPRKQRALGLPARKYQFSLVHFINLLLQNLTFKEIAARLKMTDDAVEFYYEHYCMSLSCFGEELGRQRLERIQKERRRVLLQKLENEPLKTPLLREIETNATSKGCIVKPFLIGLGAGCRPGQSPDAVLIDNRSCYVHKISSAFYYASDTARQRPFARIKLAFPALLSFDGRIICIRIAGFDQEEYVLPSRLIFEKLFKGVTGEEHTFLIPLKNGIRTKGIISPFGYRNGYRMIKNFPSCSAETQAA